MNLPRLFSALASFVVFTSAACLQSQAAEVYNFDPSHSSIAFKIRHILSDTSGRFNEFTGNVSIDPAKPENSVVDVTIQVKSIDTANKKRDEHLLGADFFDVAKNPTITFKSKKIVLSGEKAATVTGDLTMNGVTKEVPLMVTFLGKAKGMKGEAVTGWSATTELTRADFNLNWNNMIEGSKVLGETVKVEIQVEAHEAK